eukprot:scaffold29624_cov69-Skeletonema_marinoi.AAC.1
MIALKRNLQSTMMPQWRCLCYSAPMIAAMLFELTTPKLMITGALFVDNDIFGRKLSEADGEWKIAGLAK